MKTKNTKSRKMAKKVHTAMWTYIPDPLFVVTCPHCKSEIFMSTPNLITRLKLWAMKLKK